MLYQIMVEEGKPVFCKGDGKPVDLLIACSMAITETMRRVADKINAQPTELFELLADEVRLHLQNNTGGMTDESELALQREPAHAL